MRLGVEAAVVHGQLIRGDVAIGVGSVLAVGLPPGRGGRIAVPGSLDGDPDVALLDRLLDAGDVTEMTSDTRRR